MSSESPVQQSLQSANSSLLSSTQKAESAADNANLQAEGTITSATNSAISSIDDYFGQALAAGQPYATAGLAAINQMAVNLSNPGEGLTNFMQSTPYQMMMGGYGVSGNNMPTTAAGSMNDFENSPEYQFALNQGEQSAIRGQALQGNVDDPSLQYQLQTTGEGIASQQLQNYLSNVNTAYGEYTGQLNSLATLGETAMQGNQQLLANQGQDVGQLQSSAGTNIAQLQQNTGAVNANADMAIGNANANYSLTMAGLQAGSGSSSTIASSLGALSQTNTLPSLGK